MYNDEKMLQLIRSSTSCYWTVLSSCAAAWTNWVASYHSLTLSTLGCGPDFLLLWLFLTRLNSLTLTWTPPTTHIAVMMAWVWCWARGQVLLEKVLLVWDCISWILFLVLWLLMFLFVFQVLKLLEVWNCWMVISYLVWISWIRRDNNRFHILWENSCFKMTSCWI